MKLTNGNGTSVQFVVRRETEVFADSRFPALI